MGTSNDWKRKDVWLAVPFLVVGTLNTVLAVLARKNGFPWLVPAAFGLCGGVLLLLGANALVRSLRADE